MSQPDSAPGGTTSGPSPRTVPSGTASDTSSPGTASPSVSPALPTDPAELEAEIERARARLVGTMDELGTRLQPKEIARRGARDVRARLDHAIRTPEGSLRVERLAAVGAAATALVTLVAWNRRRVRRRRRS